MDERYYLILEFLLDKTEPVKAKDFPVQITHLFTPGLGKESLEYALLILNAKKLITGANRHKYSITPDGITIINDYINKRNQVPDLRDLLPAEKPANQEKIEAKKITNITRIKSLGKFISNNPLVSGIIATIIATILLKVFGVI